MEDRTIESVAITERVNGWWVSIRYTLGTEEHHGPYGTEDEAQTEADVRVPPEHTSGGP